MYIELSRNTPLLVQLFFINDQDDKSDIDGAKGNETLLNWINEEIQSLKEEQFFHKDYDETLVATYGEECKNKIAFKMMAEALRSCHHFVVCFFTIFPENIVLEGGISF